MKPRDISRRAVSYCIQILEDERRRIDEYLANTPEDTPGYADYQLLDFDYACVAEELRELYEAMTPPNSNGTPYDRLIMLLANSWDLRRRPGEIPASLQAVIGLHDVEQEHITYPVRADPGTSPDQPV